MQAFQVSALSDSIAKSERSSDDSQIAIFTDLDLANTYLEKTGDQETVPFSIVNLSSLRGFLLSIESHCIWVVVDPAPLVKTVTRRVRIRELIVDLSTKLKG